MNTNAETTAVTKTTLLNRLFPQRLDNTYRGYRIALVIFGLVVTVRALQSILIIVNGHSIAQSADGIPLETYPAAASQTIVAIFAISSLNRLIISLIGAVVLVRYRSAVPLMFAVLALSYLASQVILRFVPIVTAGTPPGPIMNIVLFGLATVGLALSLFERRQLESARSN